MALEPLSAWVTRLLENFNVDSASAGAWNLANFYGDKADFVQAQGGSVGIFTFNRALFVSELLAIGFEPTGDISWANRIATAWRNAVAGSSITAGTVTHPAWTQSVVDNLTAGTGGAVIVTLSDAKDTLENNLTNVGNKYISSEITSVAQNNVQIEAFAKAWRDATLVFNFECIGEKVTPPKPVPIVFSSE